ncbi:Rv3654c family TadE-like protein [Bifidobacterium scaligerum]|uniref:Pilus assembly protein TadE n=1 Tax=Bifidobacterium scaligerum TaxID=2052656 RepID=A0A2M9HNM6_9BIFI|nr:Rv3654c family TadE-like protein [Bifidobacterium scaligerum]PJM78422.1 pilus assembly protein TadE [Bifidobacterium scaligerum]
MRSRLEEGSGTMAGAMLVMVVAVALAVTACAGNLLICQRKARSMADLIAFQSAYALWQAESDPCALAQDQADANNVRLTACSLNDEDVVVTVAVSTMVPFVPQVEQSSRAGPVSCEERPMSS